MFKDGFLTKAMFYLKEFLKSCLARVKKLLEITLREGKLKRSSNDYFGTGSRSTFEFPSRVNLSGPCLYCIVRTLGK